MSEPDDPAPAPEASSRPEAHLAEREVRLARAARRLRSGSGELDRVLLIGGAVVVPLGLVLIVLGWIGASRTTLVFEQNAYLLSGGMLGLGLVFAGGFAYFAWWMTKLVRDAREHHERLIREMRVSAAAAERHAAVATDVLMRIEAALSAPANVIGSRPARRSSGTRA